MKKLYVLLILLMIVTMPVFAKKLVIYPNPAIVTFCEKSQECDVHNQIKEEIKKEYGWQIDFVDIDFNDEDFDDLKERYNIISAPTTLFLNTETLVTKKITGIIPLKIYEKNTKSILGEE